jgi:ketosteroid isomerase-like protein
VKPGDPRPPTSANDLTVNRREEVVMSQQHIDTVKQVYEAFGRGDVDTIVGLVADDVDWASEAGSPVAPWHGVHKGKGEVPKFFQALAATVEVTDFEPLTFAANDDDVLTVVRFAMRVPATGKQGAMELHHWFRFANGKIVRYRGTEDTALTAELLSSS